MERTSSMATLWVLALLGLACSSAGQGSDNGGQQGGTSGLRARSSVGAAVGMGGQGAAGAGARTTEGSASGGSLSSGGRAGSAASNGGGPGGRGGTAAGEAGGTGRGGAETGGYAAGGAAGDGGTTGGTVRTGGKASTGGNAANSLATGSGGARTGGVASGSLGSGGASTGGPSSGGTGSGGTVTTGTGGMGATRLAWSNPLVPERADPHVFLHSDGYYYLTATVPEYDRIELRRATSLGDLSNAQGKVIWRKHATGEMGAHIWAPEIHYIDGAWYIYFTAGRSEDIWAVRMYVLKSTAANPLEGDWTELGRIATNWDSFSLDATTFALAGQRYYLWTQKVPDYPGTSILIARMSSPTKLTGAQVVLSSPRETWETRGHEVDEAPAVLVKAGKVFVTFSASATDQNYCMGLLTADASADLLDPKSWKKSPQPVFQTSTQNSQYGPGHNSFTTTPDGRVDILVYHARKYRDIVGEPLNNPDRATRAQHLAFDSAGLPVFGVPVADGPYQADVLP